MSTTADVIKFEKTPDGSIYYFIKVFYNGKEWGLRKRYSDFLKLDEFLRKDGVNVSYALPPKRFWKRFDKSTLLERQKGLQSYLAMLLKSTASDDNLVKEFLDVDHNRLVLLKKTSIHAFKLAVRLETRALILAQHMIPIPIKNSLQARARAVSPLSPTSPFTPLSLKTKSLSFSRGFSFSTRASSRRGSFAQGPGGQGDAFAYERKISRDRSFTTVTFKTSNVDLVTLKELLKKEAYVEAVSAVWSKYDTEMKDAMGMVRDCMPVSCWESPMALDLLALGGDHMTDRDEGAGSLLMEGHHELILEAMSLPVCSFDECLSASSTSRPSHISRPSWYTSLSNDYTRPSNASRPSYTFRPSYEYTTRPSTTSQASGTSRNSLSPAVSALRESEDEGTGEGVVTEGTGGTEGTEGAAEADLYVQGDVLHFDASKPCPLSHSLFLHTCAHLDLFLSRKMRLMKLQVKLW
eukprot:CAMPEP_0173280314 /NCGR_PEP_ID=MMETSP1143-20121109/5616_1 /TAXON_ID=483371 /ORGANISM="non described non described, Strain CCMP2298" /LENGTH=464 /DNA_ID=CAMNT_0014217601 /DNA_START=197 /DNA_END=1591 /DNA_ORIENTATION=+